MKSARGFTLLELLIVVTIIGLLTAIILVAVDASRAKGRDANRATQLQEFLKAFELFYLENGVYPDDGANDPGEAVTFFQGTSVAVDLSNAGYLNFVPTDPKYPLSDGYRYCASNNRKSMAILVNTEQDNGGTDYCTISRGPAEYLSVLCTVPEPAGGAVTGLANIDRCTDRF